MVLTDYLGGKDPFFIIPRDSNVSLIIPDFFCIFQTIFAMATLGLKEMGKFFWEGREKSLPSWLSLSLVLQVFFSSKTCC